MCFARVGLGLRSMKLGWKGSLGKNAPAYYILHMVVHRFLTFFPGVKVIQLVLSVSTKLECLLD
jgi:hypothetical protein